MGVSCDTIGGLSGEWTLPQFGTGSGPVPGAVFFSPLQRSVAVQHFLDALKAADVPAAARLLDAHPELLSGRNAQGASWLATSIYYGQPAITRLFLDRGVQPDPFEAAMLGQLPRVQAFVEQEGGSPDAFAPDGFPLLGLAVFFGQKEVFRYLLDRGAHPGLAAKNPARVTPLHAAAARGDLVSAQALLERGADASARQQSDYTALHTAAQNGRRDLAELLVAHGADRTARSADGLTPAEQAAKAGHTELAAYLAPA